MDSFLILDADKSLLYKSSEHLLVGLDSSPEDEDSLEILEVYGRFLDQILEKYAMGTSRSEDELYDEVIKACSSVDELKDFIPEILSAFTNFFVYDIDTREFVITKNVKHKSKDGVIRVYTNEGEKFLLEFSPNAKSIVDSWPPSSIDNKLSTFIKKLFKVIALLACLALIVRIGVGLYEKVREEISNQSKKNVEEPDSVIPQSVDSIYSIVVDDLAENGRLYIKGDSTFKICYIISKDNSKEENSIDWKESKILSKNDTLYPKESCSIYLLTTPINNHGELSKFEKFDFDLCAYVELLIKTQRGGHVLEEMLDYNYSQPLTIQYDNVAEDICQKDLDKGLLINLQRSLAEENYRIDSISFYADRDGRNNILSGRYPQIKHIGCVSK